MAGRSYWSRLTAHPLLVCAIVAVVAGAALAATYPAWSNGLTVV